VRRGRPAALCASWIWEGARGGGGGGAEGGGGGQQSPEEEKEEGEPLIHFYSAFLPLAGLARDLHFGAILRTALRSPAAEARAAGRLPSLSGGSGLLVVAETDLGFAPFLCSFPPSPASPGLKMEADDADSPPRRASGSRLRGVVGRCCRR
jgi:hypothetical protein